MKITLPIIALAEGVEPRKRKPTVLPHLVEVEVEIRDIAPEDITGSIRAKGTLDSIESVFPSADGRIWCPVDVGVDLPAAEAMADLANDLRNLWPTEERFGLRAHQVYLAGATGENHPCRHGGFSQLGGKRIRTNPAEHFNTVVSYGIEAAQETAQRIAGELAVIGGRLYSSGLVPAARSEAKVGMHVEMKSVSVVLHDQRKPEASGMPVPMHDLSGLERLVAAGWTIQGDISLEGDAKENVAQLPYDLPPGAVSDLAKSAEGLTRFYRRRDATPFQAAIFALADADPADEDRILDLVGALRDAPRDPENDIGEYRGQKSDLYADGFLARCMATADLASAPATSPTPLI